MQNPFDWDYLTTPPASADVLDAFTILYLVLFLVGFVVCAYLYYRPWTKPFGRVFRRTSVMKATGIGMWIFGIGLFFFLIRILQIDPISFGQPIWMWLSLIAAVIYLGWIGFAWNTAKNVPTAPAGSHPAYGRPGSVQAHPVKRPVKRKTNLR